MTLHDQLFLAPITDNPQHALDIGTGTGIWAIDFGQLPKSCPARSLINRSK
mgnify:FL=1